MKLKKEKFPLLHLTKTNGRDTVWVRPSAIVLIEVDPTGATLITLSTGRQVAVEQSCEQIAGAL